MMNCLNMLDRVVFVVLIMAPPGEKGKDVKGRCFPESGSMATDAMGENGGRSSVRARVCPCAREVQQRLATEGGERMRTRCHAAAASRAVVATYAMISTAT